MPAPSRWRRNELIDFAGGAASAGYASSARLSADGVHLSRGRLAANEGVAIGAAQLVAAIVESEPFDIEWRPPDEVRPRHDWLLPNSAQIAPAGRTFNARWSAQPLILAVAFESKLVDKLCEEGGGRSIDGVRPHFGVRDPEIDAVASRLRLELRLGGASGPHYLQALAIVLAVHLLQNYAVDHRRPARGGLGARRLQRILSYVEAHLSEPVTLADLADAAGLSPHHFAAAFRASTGVAPHRYLMERRIARSCELLAEDNVSVTTVAHALGFASHGHFASTFRRFVGATPSQFKAGRR